MSYPEKQEDISKDDWIDKLHAIHITRADMNRLIMNYLVTGTVKNTIVCLLNCSTISAFVSQEN